MIVDKSGQISAMEKKQLKGENDTTKRSRQNRIKALWGKYEKFYSQFLMNLKNDAEYWQ